MIKGGARPTRIDHRDYDYQRSFGSVNAPFPPEYNTDAGLTMPNQDAVNPQFTPALPQLPFGCTDYATSELAIDIGNPPSLENPLAVDNITHANANGGADVRAALMAGKQLGWFTGIFNIQPHNLDCFDTIKLAMTSGIPERRSVSIGTPWFGIFEIVGSNGLLDMPSNFNTAGVPWHNWKICGWKMIGDQSYLIGKTWQGPNYGDKGYVYFSRTLINNLMAVEGSAAFTATTGLLPPIQTISTSLFQWLMSNFKLLLGLQY